MRTKDHGTRLAGTRGSEPPSDPEDWTGAVTGEPWETGHPREPQATQVLPPGRRAAARSRFLLQPRAPRQGVFRRYLRLLRVRHDPVTVVRAGLAAVADQGRFPRLPEERVWVFRQLHRVALQPPQLRAQGRLRDLLQAPTRVAAEEPGPEADAERRSAAAAGSHPDRRRPRLRRRRKVLLRRPAAPAPKAPPPKDAVEAERPATVPTPLDRAGGASAPAGRASRRGEPTWLGVGCHRSRRARGRIETPGAAHGSAPETGSGRNHLSDCGDETLKGRRGRGSRSFRSTHFRRRQSQRASRTLGPGRGKGH